MTTIFLFAGETSADLYGGLLLQQLKKATPTIDFWGVGGPSMQKEGFKAYLDIQAFQVMGFSDVFKALPRLLKNFHILKRAILEKNPAMVVCIDQPSFGIRLAKSLRKAGFKNKIVQFVAPTVWAYKPTRAKKMAQYFDALLTLFDFEAQYFAHTSLPTTFVGHPILELIDNQVQKPITFDTTRPIIALFPGSRPAEIRRNLAIQLKAATLFCNKHPEFVIAVVTKDHLDRLPDNIIQVPFELRYELMKHASLAIAKSGTVTLELAIHQVPSVITYKLSLVNYLIAKYLLRLQLPYYSIVNILCNKELFFEQIYPPVTAESIHSCLEEWQEHPEKIAQVKIDCLALKNRLKTSVSPSEKVCEVLCGLL